METRVITEVKVFDIISSGMVLCGHGYSDEIPPIVWHKGCVWESDEKCAQLLEQATKEWEEKRNENPWGTTDYEPELRIYWKTLDKSQNI